MAHRISVNNGKAEIAYAGETPWHGLGTRVDGLQTAADMIKCAGLEWTVELRSIYFDARVDGVRPVPGFQAVVRMDHCVTLGIVTKQYQPIQNTQAAEMMDALATEGDAHIEVAGALDPAGAMGYFARVFPRPVADSSNLSFEAKLVRWEEHQRKLLQLFETGQGNQLPGVSGTAWAVYNAVTQWTDHTYPVLQSGKVSAARTQSVLFGSYADLKQRALTEALALAA